MADEKVADPGPLGLAGFAMTTFALSSANANIWKGAGVIRPSPWRSSTGALRSCSQVCGSSFVRTPSLRWRLRRTARSGWSFYAIEKFGRPRWRYRHSGIFLLGWTIFTAYMTIAALRR